MGVIFHHMLLILSVISCGWGYNLPQAAGLASSVAGSALGLERVDALPLSCTVRSEDTSLLLVVLLVSFLLLGLCVAETAALRQSKHGKAGALVRCCWMMIGWCHACCPEQFAG